MQRWIVGLVLVALAATWFYARRDTVDGNAAVLAMIDSGKLDLVATPVGPTEVRITVTRPAGSADPVGFVVPAGTVVFPSKAGEQRMVIAVALAVDLGAGEQSRDYTVEAYCLDQFLDPPALDSSLSFRGSSGDSGEGTRVVSDVGIDLGELMPCLDRQGGSHAQQQFALWLVEGNYLDRTAPEAEEEIAQKYDAKLREETEAALRGDFRKRFLARMPGASVEAVDRALEDFIARELGAKVEERANQMARKDIEGMRDSAVRSMLGNCKVDMSGKLLFV